MSENLDGGNADGDVGGPGSTGVPAGSQPGKEWYTRGYIPHRNRLNLYQSVTFRLADSLPKKVLFQLEDELQSLPDTEQEIERRIKIENYLDSGIGCCALGHPEVAQYMQNSLLYFDGEKYRLHAWCIMPNHVHVLFEPLTDLSKIIQGWKSFTSRWMLKQNEALRLGIPDQNRVWMREYWDRYIRNERHYSKVVDYIHGNPVKAGLCQACKDWQWSSAWERDG